MSVTDKVRLGLVPARPAEVTLWLTTMFSTAGMILVLAGSSLGAVVFLAAWGFIVLARADTCLRLVFRTPLLWLVPGLALCSVVWSQAQAATLRAAIELALTVGIASLTAGFVRPRAFVSAMSFSLTLGAIASLAFGRYGTDGVTGTVVFLGVFASKNTMAMFMSFLAIFGIAVLADRGQPALLRMTAGFSFFLSIPLLLRAHSAGALMTTVISFVIMAMILGYAHLKTRERLLTLAFAVIMALPVLAIIAVLACDGTLSSAISEFVSGVLGKDPTLTGRTVLWQIALGEIARNPLLGVGYSAFWIQGNLLAEGIWRQFQISARMGFEFHDTYLEIAVELGWAGVAAFVVTLGLALERSLRLALAHRSLVTACFATIMFCLAERSFGEVDAPYPFSIGTYMLFVIAAYGADYVRARQRAAGRVRAPTARPAFAMRPAPMQGPDA